MKVKLLITGSRDYQDFDRIKQHLLDIGPDILVHGRAKGADCNAHFAAEDIGGIDIRPYPADWKQHGLAAGPIRNEFMVCEEHFHKAEPITLCLAFPMRESIGTWDCIERCLQYGVDVELGDDDDPEVVKRFDTLVAATRGRRRKRRK